MKILQRIRNQEPLFLSKTSSSEWTNRSDEQKFAENYQNSAGGVKGTWPEELPNILRVYRTTTRVLTREIPFRLTFEAKTVIPEELGLTNV